MSNRNYGFHYEPPKPLKIVWVWLGIAAIFLVLGLICFGPLILALLMWGWF